MTCCKAAPVNRHTRYMRADNEEYNKENADKRMKNAGPTQADLDGYALRNRFFHATPDFYAS